MTLNQDALASNLLRAISVSVLLACTAVAGMGQHTTVEQTGVGGRIETDYNAAGKATQMRTFGADGKLQQKADYEYLPGYYVAQQTDTTYSPTGQISKVVRHTYDESANFTGEFIQLFNESGKQIAGHKLTHDPWTGVYRCSEWNIDAQDYRAVDCPAGEEGRGRVEEPKKFTYDEVTKNLDRARSSGRSERKIERAQSQVPVHPSTSEARQEVGVVLPAQLRPGERVSGTVVENPDRFSGMPEVTVTRIAVPFESSGEASRLSGLLFTAAGEKPQHADGPITFVVPRESGLNITFRQAGNPAHSVSQTLNLRQKPASKSGSLNSYQAAALCMKDGLCAVSGPFSGDSSKTFAAFEDRPATILAETTDSAYLSIPELTAPGARPLFIAEGSKVIAFPVVVGKFVIKNNGRELQAGQTLIMFPTLEGPGDIPEPEWQTGNFPTTNLQRAQQLIPEFHLSPGDGETRVKREASEKGDSREKREVEEKNQEGEILLVVQNITADQIALRSSTNQTLVFRLNSEAFRRGEFKYDLVVEAKKASKVDVKGYVFPFLAPIAGQEFRVKSVH